MPRKIVVTVILIFTMIFTGGCWSRREVEDLSIVSALGIDRFKEGNRQKYRTSALVVRSRQLGGRQQPAEEKNPDWLVAEVGNTLYDAERNMTHRAPRTLVLYHSDIILIGQKTARQGIGDILDYLQRHKDIRLRNWVLVGKEDARTILANMPELEQTLTNEITEILTKTSPLVSESYPVDLNLFTQALLEPGWDAVAPMVRTIASSEAAGSQRKQMEPRQTIALDGLAVFRGEKMVGRLTPEETKGFLYILGKAQGGIIPASAENGKGKLSFLQISSDSRFKPIIKNGRIVMEVNIYAEANIGEVDGDVQVGDPKVLKKLNATFSRAVKGLAWKTLRKAQKKLRADVFGFGVSIHRRYPDYWREIEKDWYDIYPDLPVTIKVEGKVRRTNIISDPFTIK
ncbi:Ger(x)C family germination protein [Thermincola ferriacetica]|uniref:Ger(X)C family germination protein n=1 Tax=Thermincola ferriacetica TaxID=281456 RepID=A0A0L6W1T8_9FIRM|nr:Ger(x)C family spore germination protein [Thermincola ferriacetica]KNZ69542.1 Ger(x)C family germination protein [Thermincola ferriacetica]